MTTVGTVGAQLTHGTLRFPRAHCTDRQEEHQATDSSSPTQAYRSPECTVFRKISFAVSPGLFAVWLIVDLQLLPFPAHAVWATAIKPSPPGLQTQAHSDVLFIRIVKIPQRNEEQRGCQGQRTKADMVFKFREQKKVTLLKPFLSPNFMLKEARHKRLHIT